MLIELLVTTILYECTVEWGNFEHCSKLFILSFSVVIFSARVLHCLYNLFLYNLDLGMILSQTSHKLAVKYQKMNQIYSLY